MSDWLVKLASREETDVDRLMEALSSLPLHELRELSLDAGLVREPTAHLELFQEKMASAEELGRELARRRPDLEKTALLPGAIAGYFAQGNPEETPRSGFWRGALAGIPGALLGGTLGGAIGGDTGATLGSLAGNIAGGYLGGRTAKATPEEKKLYQAGLQKRAGLGLGGTLMNMGQKALGAAKPMAGKALNLARENPMAAMAGAGGALGAASGLVAPGRDAQGNRKSRLGAMVTRGAVGAGAGALASKIPMGGGTNMGEHVSNFASKKMGRVPFKGPAPFQASAFAPPDPESLQALTAQYGVKMASRSTGSGFIKLAMNLACGPDGSHDWLEQFKGTPLLQQAIQLEQQALDLEAQEIEIRQQEQAEREQNQQKWQMRDALWSQRDQLSLQKRQLALQLASQEVGGMAGGGEAPAEAPPAMPPAEPQAAPAPAQPPQEGMPKMAFRDLVKMAVAMPPPVLKNLASGLAKRPPPIPAAALPKNVNSVLTTHLSKTRPDLYSAAANLG